jgi:NAD-dependent DNA ligase
MRDNSVIQAATAMMICVKGAICESPGVRPLGGFMSRKTCEQRTINDPKGPLLAESRRSKSERGLFRLKYSHFIWLMTVAAMNSIQALARVPMKDTKALGDMYSFHSLSRLLFP